MTQSEATPQYKGLGPYQLGLLLGAGGMGEVYKAFDDRLGRWVAAKRLRSDATDRARQRFRREARTLAQLGHPAIVQIFDIVNDETGDWIVMELIDGPTLAELCHDGPLDVSLALDYTRQIASALEAAHSREIVHRDLKTENVMVLPSGHVKVLDFGLARRLAVPSAGVALPEGLAASADTVISRPGGIVGTPRAMSPEQALGRTVDARSDLFSFGVLLYEILTTRSPFSAQTGDEAMRRVITHAPPPAHQLNPTVPVELSELINRLLEKEPAYRHQTAAEVEAELVTIAAGNVVYHVATQSSTLIETPSTAQIETLDQDPASFGSPRDDAIVTTLLVSELVDSARLVEARGDRETAGLFQRCRQLAQELLEEHGGREINQAEGTLILFDRPWNAINYALAYQRGLRVLGLKARVGIHLGEVILHVNPPADVEHGAMPVEVEGLAKPIAARIMSLAIGAQTLITRAAYEVTRRSALSEGDRALEWRAHGAYRFKGLGGEIEVFEVGMPGAAPLTVPVGSEHALRMGDVAPTAERLPSLTLSREMPAAHPRMSASRPVTLRSWLAPELPKQPYPVLLPYTHPDFMAGRDQELARLRRLLEMPVPILGLSAPSGTGKSSLLLGALVPTLRAAGFPVALVRHPAEAGVASRLTGDLLAGSDPVDDHDWPGFVARLAEVERLAGTAPILILDQFDDVLQHPMGRSRIVLGTLMAASLARRPGLVPPLCRWLIAYRQELYGRLHLWLGDVLTDARTDGVVGIEMLPHDLSQPERFHGMTLPPLAVPAPGGGEMLADSARVFLAAIEKPLKRFPRRSPGETPRWYFLPGHAERLARAFATARLARPDAPLVPELQVVLARLLARAGPDGRITVPDEPNRLIDQALEDHLRRALEIAFPADEPASPTRRARALLALRELATSTGQRDERLRLPDLAQAIGDDGEAMLEKLAMPNSRLVVVRETPQGLRWVLAHDRMAEAVVCLVEREGRHGQLLVDSELVALRRFVTLRTALYQSREVKTSTQVSRRHFRLIEDHAEALLWDDERRAWFAACRRRRRRFAGFVSLALLLIALIGGGAWTWAHQLVEYRAYREQIVRGEPEVALKALDQLASWPDANFGDLLTLLRRRELPMDVLERGLGGLHGPDRSVAVLRAVEMALPWVEEAPASRSLQYQMLIANLVWALDFAPGRDPAFAKQAKALRDRVLGPLRRQRPPPSLPKPDSLDPDWIHVPAGSFLMGSGLVEEGDDDERPQHEVTVSAFRMQRHEVTNAGYRRLVPDHQPGAGDDLPAAYVSWFGAYTYAAWLGGRLPTEAEWEYAARAGCPHVYCVRGGQETTVDAVAWTLRNSFDITIGDLGPQPVMQLESNPWGFYDMLGNLWEWTADWYEEYPHGSQHDAWGKAVNGAWRVYRGGGFWSRAARTRAANRYGDAPSDEIAIQGFRVILTYYP